MKEILGEYYHDYEDIFLDSESYFSKIYRAVSIRENKDCILKIISLEELKKDDYDFHLESLKKEEEITKLCNSENILNIYRKFQTQNYIIFEIESYEQDLATYLSENGELLTFLSIMSANQISKQIKAQKGLEKKIFSYK